MTSPQAEAIERTLATHPLIVDAAVVSRPDPVVGERPVAFLELEQGCCSGSEALRALAYEELERYSVPDDVCIVEALPRDVGGEIDRPTLRRLVAVPR